MIFFLNQHVTNLVIPPNDKKSRLKNVGGTFIDILLLKFNAIVS